jgi:hypothetical protein
MIVTLSEYLTETKASDTLRDAQKTKPNTDDAAEAIAAFMKLNANQKKRHLEFLQAALGDEGNDVWKSGKDYSEPNRKSLNNNAAKNKNSLRDIRKGLKEAFPDTNDELLDKMEEVFTEAVATKSITEGLIELFAEDPIFQLLFAHDEQIDVVEALAERTIELENDIAWYEEQNAVLREEVEQSPNHLYEDFIASAASGSTKPYRSRHNIADDLGFNPDPENIVLMEGDTQPQRRNDSVGRYADYIERTAGNRPVVAPSGSASYLTETWDRTRH